MTERYLSSTSCSITDDIFNDIMSDKGFDLMDANAFLSRLNDHVASKKRVHIKLEDEINLLIREKDSTSKHHVKRHYELAKLIDGKSEIFDESSDSIDDIEGNRDYIVKILQVIYDFLTPERMAAASGSVNSLIEWIKKRIKIYETIIKKIDPIDELDKAFKGWDDNKEKI